jgi:carboxyl-terminal processing protease
MKRFLFILFISFSLLFSMSCDDDDSIEEIPKEVLNQDIENFIWGGLNFFYLWQDDVPDLSDQRFTSQEELNNYLKDYSDPESLFDNLLYSGDKYSWIVDDYIALEKELGQGISGSNGVEFNLVYESGSDTDVFGSVRYIIAGSDASTKNIKRGDIFHAVNGTPLTANNFGDLLFGSNDSYTLNLADYNNGNLIDNGVSVLLTKSELQENPIHVVTTVDEIGKKIGYIMYNSFTNAFDSELNDAFATLKVAGVTDLVLDLRYNSGGSVNTAIYLSGMITGQFTGELFTKERWNSKWLDYLTENDPDYLESFFVEKMDNGEILNSLNLDNVVVLTTGRSASASELIINGLNPYINVTTIGTKTEGKSVGSITIYDSESYGKEGVNPDHTYAMQPIVLEIVNKLGENDNDGFDPTIVNPENYGNMGILGDPSEPLFARAIQFISTGSKSSLSKSKVIQHIYLSDSKKESLTGSNMYIDKPLPFLK